MLLLTRILAWSCAVAGAEMLCEVCQPQQGIPSTALLLLAAVNTYASLLS
jgi:hypothetical protein